MKLTFWGAAQQVTGSMFLLELDNGYKILIDCGSDYDHRSAKDAVFPFEASQIDLVLLTHAHLDHSGRIPLLFSEGYQGQVLSTTPTYELAELLLQDNASLNAKRLQRNYRRGKFKKSKPADPTVFLQGHVEKATNGFVTIPFNQRFQVSNNVHVCFIPTGHLLGAANIILEVEEKGETKSIGFSGDIGRKNSPLLQDPQKMPQVDYLICESTYGNRNHSDNGKPDQILEEIIKKTCVDIPGRLIIPAFSVGRTQALLYSLNRLNKENRLPAIKIFADSPMAEQSTRIYQKYHGYLNEEANAFNEKHHELFDFDNLITVSNSKESKSISDYRQASIIIASSGMLTGGRMNYHIKKNIHNPYASIMFVGYCAEGTPGYQLMREHSLKVKGRTIPVDANILYTDVFSGHAGQNELIDYIKVQDKSKIRKIFLVHGDSDNMNALKYLLNDEGYGNVVTPQRGEEYLL